MKKKKYHRFTPKLYMGGIAMSHHIHLKKVLCLLIGLMLFIPDFLPCFEYSSNVLAEENEIQGHTWKQTLLEFLPAVDPETGILLGSGKYLYYGCHTCTGVTMLVTSYRYGIGFITNDHGSRGGRKVWSLVGSYNTVGKTKKEIIQWICRHADIGDVLTNGYATAKGDKGAHTAVITSVDAKKNHYLEIDEYGTERKGHEWRLFEGQKVVDFAMASTTTDKFRTLYIYRYNGYSGKFENATIKKEVPIFYYEATGFSVHKEDAYNHGKGKCAKDLSNRLKIPAGTHIKVLTGMKKRNGYQYVYYKPKDKSTGLYDKGVYAYVANKYIDFGIKIDKTNFPDESFRKYIQSSEINQDNNEYLSEAEIQKVTKIDCKELGIKSLKGIEHFTSLTTLDCSQNKLENLDLSNNTALEGLDCSNNKLTKLDISKNNSLVSLLCGFNKLTELDVKQKVKLKTLNCGVNDLTELDVSKNTKLQGLECDNNKLTKLDVSKNTALSDLSCGDNQLTKLDVSNNVKLTNLDFYNNRIKEIDISKNTKLIKLNCDSNQLKKLDVSKNKQLSNLICDWNHLDKLDISKNTLLEYLSCEFNQLKELSVSKNTKLYYLDCAANQIEKLNVGKLAHLQFLFCSDNRLTSLTLGKKNKLDTLYCYRNNLKSLDISKCPKILNLIKKGKKTKRDGIISYTIGDSSFKFDSSVEIANKVKQKKKN